MNEKNQKRKYIHSRSFNGVLLLIIIIGLTILTSYVPWIKVSIAILATAILILFVSIIIIYCVVSYLYSKSILAIQEESRNQLKETFPISIYDTKINNSDNKCVYHNFVCCAEEVLNSDYYKETMSSIILDESATKRYCIMSDTQFDEYEAKFFDDNKNGEIWVVSYALETEILTSAEREFSNDASLLKSMETVKNNIQTKNGKYVQFVAVGSYGEKNTNFRNRRSVYWSYLEKLSNEEKKERLPVIIIDDKISKDDEDFNYFVKLTSTVLFVSNGPDEEYIEGYFTLRPDTDENTKAFERRTIMYKMPDCMRDEYYDFLKRKKEEYYKDLQSKKGDQKNE